jgi:pimeloyl-ACP methyl ester carboxylesterase
MEKIQVKGSVGMKLLGFALLMAIGCAACGGSSSGGLSAVGGTLASFKSGPCPAPEAAALGKLNASCGTLTAPQNRSNLNEGTVQLPVAMIPSQTKPALADPILYMAGGPGANAISQAQDLVNVGLNQKRELIIMNQRGVAYTVPNLACPEIDKAFAVAVGLAYDSPANETQHIAAVKACHDRLVGQGIDLSNFNTAESESDVADLRTVLKIAQWDIYGLSYGTDLALSLMRDHPQGIRSVIIDAVLPPSAVSLGWTWTNCAVWEVPPASGSVRQITVSSIPTLVLNGSFDGKSAPQWGIYAAGTLQNSTTVTVPSSGHGALFLIQLPPDTSARACTENVVASFLANPMAPDTSCVAGLTDIPFDTSAGTSSLSQPAPEPVNRFLASL